MPLYASVIACLIAMCVHGETKTHKNIFKYRNTRWYWHWSLFPWIKSLCVNTQCHKLLMIRLCFLQGCWATSEAFVITSCLLQYTPVPFGLNNAPWTFIIQWHGTTMTSICLISNVYWFSAYISLSLSRLTTAVWHVLLQGQGTSTFYWLLIWVGVSRCMGLTIGTLCLSWWLMIYGSWLCRRMSTPHPRVFEP